MFEALKAQPADGLLGLIKMFNADGRASKIDLGVGVYRDATGATPVLKAVKEAEKILLKSQDSKKYLGPEGDAGSTERLQPYIFGASERIAGRIAALQTPGGTGALRLGAELIRKANPRAAVQLGAPTWPTTRRSSLRPDLRSRRRGSPISRRRRSPSTACGRRSTGPRKATSCCCTAAAKSDGMDFSRDLWKAIVEVLVAAPADAFHRPRLPGPRRRARGGRLGDPARARQRRGSAGRLFLRQEFRPLPGPRRRAVRPEPGLRRDGDRDEQPRRARQGQLVDAARSRRRGRADHSGAAQTRSDVARGTRLHARPHQRQSPGAGRSRPGARLHPRPARPVLEPRHVEVAGDRAARASRHLLHRVGRINLAGMQPADADAIVAALAAEGCLRTRAAAA